MMLEDIQIGSEKGKKTEPKKGENFSEIQTNLATTASLGESGCKLFDLQGDYILHFILLTII